MTDKRIMMLLPALGLIIVMLAAGCGASKKYVDQAVSDERTRTETAVGQVAKDVEETRAEIERLQSLTAQLEKKTDLAINQAKGFEAYQVIWEGEIYFDLNSSKITVEAQSILDEAGDKMIANKGSVMELSGYCDPRGSDTYNLDLGQKRAMSAKYYLVDNFGANLYRFFLMSYGERKAVASGDSNVSYNKERKVKMKLWGKP